MKTWVISDTHFGHPNIVKFTTDQGYPIRGLLWDNHVDHDEELIRRWNETVAPEDKVYHLGDFAISKKAVQVAQQLNGRKTLIAGNHDIFNTSIYLEAGFKNVRAYKHFPNSGVILSHIPLHPNQFERRFKWNIHGHLHHNLMDDPRYINVCVEHTGYAPLNLDTLIKNLTSEAVML